MFKKIRITRQDNEKALEEAYQELDALMDTRSVNERRERYKPKPEVKAEEKKPEVSQEDAISESDLDAALQGLE